MDKAKDGRIFGAFLADVVYFSALLGITIVSGKFLSKLLKAAITLEVMKNTTKNKPMENEQNYYTDAQVTQAVDTARQIDGCTPMTNDLDHSLIDSICSKLKKGDEFGARLAIDREKTEIARPWCINTLKTAATVICTCSCISRANSGARPQKVFSLKMNPVSLTRFIFV